MLLTDIEGNEQVVARYQAHLEEQEKVMTDQDNFIKTKEEELSAANSKVAELTDEKKALLKVASTQTLKSWQVASY